MYYAIHTAMAKGKRTQKERPDPLLAKLAKRWPVAKGSLAEVRKPCIRPQCRACAEGRKHPGFIFSYKAKGRRRCMYVPRPLVPALRQAIGNGRRLEEWMSERGAALIRAYRARRRKTGRS